MAQPEIPGNGVGIPVMPFGSDGSNWIALLVDALGRLQIDAEVDNFPADPATQTTLAAILTELALKADLTETQPVESKDGDKIFSFESVVEESLSNVNLSAGTNMLDGTSVATGKVWKLNYIGVMYTGTVPTSIRLKVIGLAAAIQLLRQDSPDSDRWYTWTAEIYLQAGDYVQGFVDGATLNDDLLVRYAGIQMNAP